MSPQERYEARKAQRKQLGEWDDEIARRSETILFLDMLDRFVTAVERIANAAEVAS